MVKKFKLGLTI